MNRLFGRFATEPLILNFLMMRTTFEILTSKPSAFNNQKISAGSKPCLWRSSIRVLAYFETLAMLTFRWFESEWQTLPKETVTMVANSIGPYWANHMRGHWKLLAWPHRGWSLIWKLCLCLHTAQIALQQANANLAQFPPLSRLWQQNKTKPAMLLGCGITVAVYLWRVTR